jgi:hypothetical protein
MSAELAHVEGRAARWRFAAGVVRVVTFPPVPHRGRVLVAALGGLAVAVAATGVAAVAVPSLSVFVALLCLLLTGYATVVVSRSSPRGPLALVAGAVALAGITGTVAGLAFIATAHPDATSDPTRVFSVFVPVVLTGCLAVASRRFDDTVLRWALAGTLASGVGWALETLTGQASVGGVTRLVSPVGALAVLAVSAGAAAVTRDAGAGARAGLLAALLSAPVHVALDITALARIHHFTLTDPYDIARYPSSGFHDVASFLLSDVLGGVLITGLVVYPMLLAVLGSLGGLVGAGLRSVGGRPGAGRSRTNGYRAG